MTLFLLAVGLYLAGGALALALSSRPRAALWSGTVSALAAGAVGLVPSLSVLLGGGELALSVSWSVPGGALSLGIDPLTSVFLVPVFALSAVFSVYGAGYLAPHAGKRSLGAHAAFYNALAASMALVLCARNGVLFLMAWECMSLTSFFLVAFDDEEEEVRDASRLYLVAMHLGVGFLFALFALLARDAGSFEFSAFAARTFPPATATGLFALALLGFGTKAGLWPLHVWLPRAHPAAPSHVSALMSGVMVKTGIYGILRVLLVLGSPQAAWGVTLLAVGGVSAVLGLLNALGQRDLKALLAYSTGENVGIIALGLGAGVLGAALGQPEVAAAGFAGALLHVWNHGLFKGLLFLGAGSVVHATGTRNLERLGGLWKRLPLTGTAFLVGAAAIAALPPLNGLASEWLIYTGFFRAGAGVPGLHGLAALTAAAVLALVGGLALACFTRAFGAVFLGVPRSPAGATAHEGGAAMTAPLWALAGACLAAGLAPGAVAALLGPAVTGLVPGDVELSSLLRPLRTLGLFSLGTAAFAAALLALRRALLRGRSVAAAPTWDCGFAAPTARMQYTASSFAEPLSTLFRGLLRSRTDLVPPRSYFPLPGEGRLAVEPADAADALLWRPVSESVGRALRGLRFLQQGRVQLYLVYLFTTVVALLVWALAV